MKFVYCKQCHLFEDYEKIGKHEPENCATFLCNNGTCPYQQYYYDLLIKDFKVETIAKQ